MTSGPTTAWRPWRSCRRFDTLAELRGVIGSDAAMVAAPAAGSFDATIATAELGPFQLVAGRFGCPTLTAGFTSADELSATVVLEAAGGSMNGIPLVRGAVVVFRPGAIFEAWSGRGYRFVSVSFSRATASSLARERRWRLPGAPGADVFASRVEPADLAAVEAQARRLDLWTPVRRAELDPGHARVAVDAWSKLLGGVWRRAVPRPGPSRRRAGDAALKRAHAYLEAHLCETIRSSDLCRAARTNERTLEHRFRQRFGIPPLAFAMATRLSAARTALRRPDERDVPVADTARQFGFRHLGRFAAAYRRMFGESPAQTRRAAT